MTPLCLIANELNGTNLILQLQNTTLSTIKAQILSEIAVGAFLELSDMLAAIQCKLKKLQEQASCTMKHRLAR